MPETSTNAGNPSQSKGQTVEKPTVAAFAEQFRTSFVAEPSSATAPAGPAVSIPRPSLVPAE